jgi:hypothetical protein
MKTYRRILVPTISSCPSAAQLTRCGEIAQTSDCKARVVLFIDRRSIFESDGPAGVFPEEEVLAGKVSDARQRLAPLLNRSGLGWVQSSVTYGVPKKLLTSELRTWQPDLVIVTKGWGHAHWVERAAREAGIPVPDIMGVAPDGPFRKLLNALLPLSINAMHFPLDNGKDPIHGGHHGVAG